jgi:hypothetical protein
MPRKPVAQQQKYREISILKPFGPKIRDEIGVLVRKEQKREGNGDYPDQRARNGGD